MQTSTRLRALRLSQMLLPTFLLLSFHLLSCLKSRMKPQGFFHDGTHAKGLFPMLNSRCLRTAPSLIERLQGSALSMLGVERSSNISQTCKTSAPYIVSQRPYFRSRGKHGCMMMHAMDSQRKHRSTSSLQVFNWDQLVNAHDYLRGCTFASLSVAKRRDEGKGQIQNHSQK